MLRVWEVVVAVERVMREEEHRSQVEMDAPDMSWSRRILFDQNFVTPQEIGNAVGTVGFAATWN